MASLTVRVVFFASLREAVTDAALEVDLRDGATLTDLRQDLARCLDAQQLAAIEAQEVRIAVNQELVHDSCLRLAAGDEVAFMPPVTGG